VTSPNEPGAHQKGDPLNGDGSVDRTGAHRATPAPGGRTPDTGDAPPWQRGAARASQSPLRQTEPNNEGWSAGPTSGVDARLNRFIAGTSASGATYAGPKNNPTQELDAVPARNEGPAAEAYASELPDLSGPIPRAQRKSASDRPDTGAASGTGRSAISEARESRDAKDARESREGRVSLSRRTRGPVRASMQIRRIDPWSTLKVSLMLSVALFFVWMIAVAFLYLVLGGMGVWAKLNSNVGDLLNNTSGSSGELVSSGTIFGGAVLIGLVNIVLLTAMATIAAFVYNLTTDLIGGIEVTLADRD
jgi:Transmembrane domain of unknown function (DUF3566)